MNRYKHDTLPQIDNVKEFSSLKSFLTVYAISQLLSCYIYIKQNSSIERKYCHIANMGLALFVSGNFLIHFCGETFNTVVNVTNVLPTLVSNYKNPYKILFNKQFNYKSFKILVVHFLFRPYNTNKFNFSLFHVLVLFIGYRSTHLCLYAYGKTFVTHDEFVFPYALSNNPFKPSSSSMFFNLQPFQLLLTIQHLY